MDIFNTEGIVLHALPFRDYDQILTVFSAEHGLTKFIVKKAFSGKGRRPVASSFTQAEFTYSKKKSELLLCHEIEILNQHLPLRQELNSLEASCEMLQAILASQWAEKPAPDLYLLLIAYLKKIPDACDPFVVSASFRLKVLKYEGLFRIQSFCAACCLSLVDGCFLLSESFCGQHAPPSAIGFSREEILVVEQLLTCQYLSQLVSLSIPSSLSSKIKQLFQCHFPCLDISRIAKI
jgi:DNA repair protein RecO (recombination protein O)